MKIGFFRGRVPVPDDKGARLWWAQTGAEFWVLEERAEDVTRTSEHPAANAVEHITDLELPDIGDEGMETIIVNVLKGGYLEKPGVKGGGEAVLFMLVNEAIQKLAEIEKRETFLPPFTEEGEGDF